MPELYINYERFVEWVNYQSITKIIAITHSCSHSIFNNYLKENTGCKAIYVFSQITKFCKKGEWSEFTNPDWMQSLIYKTNQLHNVEVCNKYNMASLGKKLTKSDVLKCMSKKVTVTKQKIKV